MAQIHRVLVTGGAGFLGSHLCERLVEEGHDVICLDNFFTSQKTNVAHLLGRPNFDLVRHDVTHPFVLEVDQIYNLACPAAPGHYQYNPIKTMKTSVLGAIHMLGLAKRCRAKILQASTSEIYGDPEVHPQPETYRGSVNPIGPRACYDEGKRAAETLFMDYHRMHRTNVRIVRIFNTYGPRMHPYDGRVVSNFIRQALRGEDITVFGDGSQTRSFCYRDDLVDGMMRMMNGRDDFIGPVNLGNQGEFTILELAKLVIELTGSRSKIIHKNLPVDDPTRRRPDITLARQKLGWEPRTPLRDGLEKTIDWFRTIRWDEYRAPTPNY
jgi:UDP-glucuronate decarboxylase